MLKRPGTGRAYIPLSLPGAGSGGGHDNGQGPINPQTKLATNRWWHNTTLPELLNVEDADEDELYGAMDWYWPISPLLKKS